MREFRIETKSGTSNVIVGESIKNVLNYLPTSDVFIITDSEVYRQYHSFFPSFPVFEVKVGEPSKSIECVSALYSWLIGNEATRHSFILGIGGGVVCDIAGFVASTYMRGVVFGFVSTTWIIKLIAADLLPILKRLSDIITTNAGSSSEYFHAALRYCKASACCFSKRSFCPFLKSFIY